MRDDLYINTKEWQNSSDDWVKTMTKSKENKEIKTGVNVINGKVRK